MGGKVYGGTRSNTGGLEYRTAQPVGIKTRTNSIQNFEIYPNPNNGLFTVQLSIQDKQQVGVKIYDIRGTEVRSENWGLQNGSVDRKIDLSSLAKGIYFIHLQTDKNVVAKKVIIE